MDKQPICTLTGTELEYAFARVMQYEMLGGKNGPFALHSEAESTIYVFGGTDESVSFSSFGTNFAEIPLQKGRELGASLHIQDGVAKCCLQGFSCEGEDYIQALMRALIVYLSTNQK